MGQFLNLVLFGPFLHCKIATFNFFTNEGVELERKQNVFWNQWSSGNNLGTCTIWYKKLFWIRITLTQAHKLTFAMFLSSILLWTFPLQRCVYVQELDFSTLLLKWGWSCTFSTVHLALFYNHNAKCKMVRILKILNRKRVQKCSWGCKLINLLEYPHIFQIKKFHGSLLFSSKVIQKMGALICERLIVLVFSIDCLQSRFEIALREAIM